MEFGGSALLQGVRFVRRLRPRLVAFDQILRIGLRGFDRVTLDLGGAGELLLHLALGLALRSVPLHVVAGLQVFRHGCLLRLPQPLTRKAGAQLLSTSRRPSPACQIRSAGAPITRSFARLMKESASALSAPRPNKGPIST